MLLWVMFAVLTAAVVYVLVTPLLHPAKAAGAGRATRIYKDQLSELEREHAEGRLDAEGAEQARREIARRLLAAADRERAEEGARHAAARAPRLALALVFLVPAAALGLYLHWGSPDLPSQPFGARPDLAIDDMSVDQLAAQLRAKLDADPDNAKGWALLARTYTGLERYAEAAAAYKRAVDLEGDAADANLLGGYAEAVMLEAGGTVTPLARDLLTRAIARDPADPRVRYYLALAREQDGDVAGARADLEKLLADAPPDAPWRAAVAAHLGEEAAVPDEAAIRGMVDGLAERLAASPEDLEGWLRLMRSYVVLGEREKANAAYASAKAAFAADATATAQIDAAAGELGIIP